MLNAISLIRNKHEGERCFILATGPSLNETNLDLVRDEIKFGVNTLYRHPIKCQYMCVADAKYWEAYREDFLNTVEAPIFSSFEEPAAFYLDGMKGTVVFLALDVAYIMGFSEVYLIGCDHSGGGAAHFDTVDSSPIDKVDVYHGTSRVSGVRNYNSVFEGYEKFKKLYESNDRKLVNCTVGGCLDVFPRANLEDICSR